MQSCEYAATCVAVRSTYRLRLGALLLLEGLVLSISDYGELVRVTVVDSFVRAGGEHSMWRCTLAHDFTIARSEKSAIVDVCSSAHANLV